ncbi:mitochondrial distribution and morphology protein family 31/32 [Mrakia frigida]|uniref:mitochondrial distribution and morphology protein n=1 Tax=Mrakia frigida TaxID=29902 RepID=UPI003FCC0A48
MGIRWRWWTTRGFRKFGPDEWSAVVSWVLVGHLGWLVLGTTTFFCMVLYTANSLSLQGHVARLLSDYFTQGSGITVVFESALVPHFFDSTISLRNVFISRRPKDTYPSRPPVTKTSTSSSSIFSVLHRGSSSPPDRPSEDDEDAVVVKEETEEDTNYSMFDLNVDSIDVTLSFVSWLNGEGLVKKAVVRGVRGVIDRRSVTWDPADPWVPSEWRHPSQPADGSFHLDSLQVEDLLCTVYQPGDFRPYNVSIFRADIGTFRKKWLFYDFLSAHSITGQYDNCLCSLHKPQRIGKTMGSDEKEGKSKRMARLRIDGLPIDHIQDTTAGGPLAWITAGKLDAVCDISFPSHPSDEVDFSSVLTGIIDNVNENFSSPPTTPDLSIASEEAALAVEAASSSTSNDEVEGSKQKINPGQRPLGKPALVAPEWLRGFGLGGGLERERDQTREVVMDIDLRFRDLKAAVPFRTGELSYVNSALIRPIVAFINANRTLLPIRCRVVQDLSEFDGSWTVTGLLDATSAQVYSALAHHVSSQSANTQRMKAVGVWSLQMTAETVVGVVRSALLQGRELGGGGLVDEGVQTI